MTTFSAMDAPTSARWISWAQTHDWGRDAFLLNGQIRGCIDVPGETPAFTTPTEMRDWAGY